MGVADHAEQRHVLRLAVDHPVGVENLVAAVFGVRLRKHHQLDVGRIAFELLEIFDQVIDLVSRQRQPHVAVGFLQRIAAALQDIHRGERLRLAVAEDFFRRAGNIRQHGFGHAVVQQRQHCRQFGLAQRLATWGGKVIHHAALDALHIRQPAMLRDIGSLGGPRRDRADARHHQQALAFSRIDRLARRPAQPQHPVQQAGLRLAQRCTVQRAEIPVARSGDGDAPLKDTAPGIVQRGAQFFQAKSG